MKRNKDLGGDAFEDALLEAPSYGEYRWNLMADRLHLYAERNEWKKRSNGNKAQGNSLYCCAREIQ